MSGPEPVLAAIAALGCTSSSDSLVTLTFTPVALVKLATSSMKASSSAWMKRFQRRSEIWAFFSGFQGAVCAQALAHSSSAGPVSATDAPSAVLPCRNLRLLNGSWSPP